MDQNESNKSTSGLEPERQPVQSFTTPSPTQPTAGSSAFSSDAMPQLPVKKSKKGLIIGLVIAGVVLLGLVTSGIVFAFVYNNPSNVVADALSKALSAKSGSVDGSATLESEDATVKLKLNAASNEAKESSADMDLTVTASGQDYTLNGHFVGTKDEMYIKLDDLRSTIDGVFGDDYSELIDMYYGSLLDKIDGKWVLIKQDNLEELSGGSVSNEQSQCVQNEIAKVQTDASLRGELIAVYKKHPLFSVESKGSDSNGNRYTLTPVSNEKAQEFLKAVVETKTFKAVDDCVDSDLKGDVLADSDSDSSTKSDKPTGSIDLWIDGWSHTLNKFSVNVKDDEMELTSEFLTKFNTNPTVTIPDDATTIDDLKSEIEAFQQQSMSAYESSDSAYDYTY